MPIYPNIPFTIPTSPGPLPAYCDLSTYSYSTQQLYTFNATGLLVWCGATFVNSLYACSDPSVCSLVNYVGDTTCGSLKCEVWQANGTTVAFIATEYPGVVGLFNVDACPEGTINVTSTICNQTVSTSSPNQLLTTDIPVANFIGGCDGTASPKYSTFSSLVQGNTIGQIKICPTTRFFDISNISVSIYSCHSGFECGVKVDQTNCGDDYNCFYGYVYGDFMIQVESPFPSLNWTYGVGYQCPTILEQIPPICAFAYTSAHSPNQVYTTDISPSHFATSCDASVTSNPTWTSHFNYDVSDEDFFACATTPGKDIIVNAYDCTQTLSCNYWSGIWYYGPYSCYTIYADFGSIDGPVHVQITSMDDSQVDWTFSVGDLPPLPEVELPIETMCNNSYTFEAQQNVSYRFNIPPAVAFSTCDFTNQYERSWASYAQVSIEDQITICANSLYFRASLYSCQNSMCAQIDMEYVGDGCYGAGSTCYWTNATGDFVVLATTDVQDREIGWAYSLNGCPAPIENLTLVSWDWKTPIVVISGSTTTMDGVSTTDSSTTGSTTMGSTTDGSTTMSSTTDGSTTIGITTGSTMDGSTTGATTGSNSTSTTLDTTGDINSTTVATTGTTNGGDGAEVASGERLIFSFYVIIFVVAAILI